jgi:nucleoside phosphorylase
VYAVLRWRLDPAAARTVRSLASRLPVGTAVAIGLAVAFASTRSFSTDAKTVLGDVLVATAAFVLAVAAVRLRAISR